MPSSPTPFSRRRLLAAGASLALLGVVTTACGPSAPPAPDALEEQVVLARRDADLAVAAATGVTAPLADTLQQVAARRQAHARVLTTEIARVAGTAATTTETTSTAAPGAVTVDEVVVALRDSAQWASDAASGQSGYRAGLLGSIAAACTVDSTVTLAGPESGR